jgi:hypothetical protein
MSNKAVKPELRYPPSVTLDLGVARENVEMTPGGNSLRITAATGQVYIRMNEPDNPIIDLNDAFQVMGYFYRFFITNTAQAGKTATIVISTSVTATAGVPPVSLTLSGLPINITQSATTVKTYNIVLAAANTEYSQLLPNGTVAIEAHILDDSAEFRLAFEAGKVATPVAPYMARPIGAYYYKDNLLLTGVTLYAATTTGIGKVLELVVWSI